MFPFFFSIQLLGQMDGVVAELSRAGTPLISTRDAIYMIRL